ncbi:BTAD domain-containing putative transcriptional regulator [Nonomuraea sp. NPDC050663]|uniref:BTAD domain-containing putative transcriptional regulator n=1 Tax=Nonomuraea sp. NPDC050663 TaxID=3364370 RepID=UPI0037BC5E8A
MLTFHVLGPLEVRSGGRPVRISGRKPRMLLASLLLDAGHVVPADRLVEALWPDRPPRSAHANIRTYVSSLRPVIGAIRAEGSGYAVDVPDGALDLQVFEDLAALGEPEAALSLWRGTPLADLPECAVWTRRLDHIQAVRLRVADEVIARFMAAGRYGEAAAEVRVLIGEHPYREDLWQRLMIALHAAGRKAEALRAFHEVREQLVGELGVEPGAELRRCHQTILGEEPPPPAPSAALAQAGLARPAALAQAGLAHPAALDPTGLARPAALDPAVLDQRPAALEQADPALPSARERARLPLPDPAWPTPRQLPPDIADFVGRAAELDTLTPTHPLTVISGPPGVGKSALAVRLAHRLKHTFPTGQLHLTLGEREPEDLLGQALRALGLIPAGNLHERAALLRSQLAERPVLLLLDDARDATQIEPLLPGNGSVVIVTSRQRITTLPGARLHHLGPLPEADAVELLGRIIGAEHLHPSTTSPDAQGVRAGARVGEALDDAVQRAVPRHGATGPMVARAETSPREAAAWAEVAARAEVTARGVAKRAGARLGEAPDDAVQQAVPRLGATGPMATRAETSPREAVTRAEVTAGEVATRAEAAARAVVAACGRLPLAIRDAGARLLARPGWTLEMLAQRLDEHPLTELRQVRAVLGQTFRRLPEDLARPFATLSLLGDRPLPGWLLATLLHEAGPQLAGVPWPESAVSWMGGRRADTRGGERWASSDTEHWGERWLGSSDTEHWGERWAASAATEPWADPRADPRSGPLSVPRAEYLAAPRAEHLADLLVDAGLLDPAGADPLGQPRYRLPDLVRRHAATLPPDRLTLARVISGWTVATQSATARLPTTVFTLTPATTTPAWRLPEATLGRLTADPVAWFEAERETLAETVRLAAEVGPPGSAWALAAALVPYYDLRCQLRCWHDSHAVALDAARAAGDLYGEAAMLRGLGQVSLYQDRYGEAEGQFAEARRIFQEMGDRRAEAISICGLGAVSQFRGRPALALGHFGSALGMFLSLGDLGAEAYARQAIGRVWLGSGDLDQASTWLGQAMRLARELGDPHREGCVSIQAGRLHELRAEPDQAMALQSRALDLFDGLGDRHCGAYALQGLAGLHAARGEWAVASARLERARAIFKELGDRSGAAASTELLGRLPRA